MQPDRKKIKIPADLFRRYNMEQNVLFANIVGFAISAIGVILYASGYVKGEPLFCGWRTIVGFLIVVVGSIVALALLGELDILFA